MYVVHQTGGGGGGGGTACVAALYRQVRILVAVRHLRSPKPQTRRTALLGVKLISTCTIVTAVCI